MAAALARPPAVVLVEGEAGIGKSRLVQEFLATSPAARKETMLVAACPPFRQPATLGPIVDALRHAVSGSVAGLGLSGLAGALRSLFPEWADQLPPAPEPLADATAMRHRLFRALAELADGVGAGVLVVEDVHWADEATVEFLLFLVSRPRQRVSLVVTWRPEDVSASSLLRLSSRLPAGTVWERITVGPLDADGTAALVSSMLPGGQVSGEFAGFLHAHTEGLPLAIEESVRLLRDRRDLRRQGGEWVRRHLGALAVPSTVRDAVLERTGRLGSDARAVLQGAAVLTDPGGEPVLSAVTGVPSSRVRSGLAGALGCGLLHEDSRGLVSFRHVLAARAIYEAIPVPQRQEMHLRAGRALERLSPLPVASLARHFREAGQASEWCRYAEQAADLALASGDEATAATLLHDLVTNAEGLPASIVVRLTRKIPLYALGRHAFIDDLARTLRSILTSDGITPALRAEAGCHLGRILMHVGEYEAGAVELERAIPGLANRPVEAARAMLSLGWPSQTLWPARVHKRWLDRAAATAVSLSIPASDRLAITVERACALLMLGEEAGWAAAAELPGRAATPQERQPIALGRANVGGAAMQWGRYDEARRQLDDALRIAGRYDYMRLHDGILVTLAHLDWLTGAWTGLTERAETLAGLDDPLLRLDAMLVAGLLKAAAGSAQAAEEKLQHVLDEERRRGIVDMPLEPASALARLRLGEGRVNDALALTNDPMRVITSKGIWLWATDIAPARAQALVTVGRRGEAAELVTAFARGLRGCNVPAPRAALALCRAILAEGGGEHGRAATLFARAAAAWQALPRPYDALLAREQQGCCLLAAGQSDAGVAVLRDVFRELSGLGASGDAERVVRLLRGQGVHVPRLWRHGRSGYGSQLSPREIEVVRLVVVGQTTREIAQELCRSPKTVGTQLQSAMRKLNVPSRAALAARAVEAGIAANGHPQGNGAGSSETRHS
jgi:DNA-binding CsgD family transcriptional regulator/tetratricopeptide (TPR) repeat protein